MHRRDCLGLMATGAFAPLVAQAQTRFEPRHDALAEAWTSFRDRFMHAGRIVDTGNNGITHTEGLGVGMLAAQACGDRASFDALWNFAGRLRRVDNLHAWNWVPEAGIVDVNNASDGDLYMAWALLRGGVRWRDSGLIASALSIAEALRRHCMPETIHGHLLSPGVRGFISHNGMGTRLVVVNPSYWALPGMRELGAAEAAPRWKDAVSNASALLQRLRFGSAQLPADWVVLTDPPQPWPERPARFGFEAIRVPLFLVWDRQHRHPTLLSCARYLREPGFAAWQALNSNAKAAYAGSNGFEAVARLARKAAFGTPFALPSMDGDYYSSSLVLLVALAARDLGWL